jgi:hypothetical protein
MNGGSGGAVVDAGNPAGSRLWTCSTKKEEPFMPPEGAPLEAKDLAMLSKWIADGVLQAKGSVAKKSTKPKVDLAFAGGAGKPTGPVARPENVLLEPVIVTPRTSAVIAMAASPWTSLLAVAGQKQILLYDTDSHELAGILPYPEGYARSLKFSSNGSLLVMGGGPRRQTRPRHRLGRQDRQARHGDRQGVRPGDVGGHLARPRQGRHRDQFQEGEVLRPSPQASRPT